MDGKSWSILGVVLAIIAGWDKISAFISSVASGFQDFWASLAPVIQLGLIIWLFIWMGKKK